jgi:hypothetical protein
MAEKITITDFSIEPSDSSYETDYVCYIYSESTLFNSQHEEIELTVHKNYKLSDCISEISDYITWLGSEFKNSVIKYFNEHSFDKVDSEWYDALDSYSASICVEDDGTIYGEFMCCDVGDNDTKVFAIYTTGKEINCMEEINFDEDEE